MIDERCKSCIRKMYDRLLDKFNVEKNQRLYFWILYQQTLLKNKNFPVPEIQRILNQSFCNIINNFDPFLEEKTLSNKIALDLYKEWKHKLILSDNQYNLALKLSIAGNIMDYGANNSFDIYTTITKALNTPLAIDHSIYLKNKIKNANKILFLGDNAGEIVFDKLFIETLMHNNIIYVVKGEPILNDVTIEDTYEVGMDIVADIISNGYNAPSTIIKKCSRSFQNDFNDADLIISKGQGNLEGLIDENDSRIFFLLMVKCDVMADKLNVPKGSLIVYNKASI